MNIPEEMKLNKFQLVKIPKGKEIWRRLAGVQLREPDASAYSGDDHIPDMNPTETSDYLEHRAEYEEMLAREEAKKEKKDTDNYNKDEDS